MKCSQPMRSCEMYICDFLRIITNGNCFFKVCYSNGSGKNSLYESFFFICMVSDYSFFNTHLTHAQESD